jgi:hypothetical protein
VRAAEVVGPRRRGQPVGRVVGDRDGLVVIVERQMPTRTTDKCGCSLRHEFKISSTAALLAL